MTEQERNELHERIAQVKERVARAAEKAGKKPEDIILVAASKMNDAERVQEAIRAGIEVCGENRVQELLEKYEQNAYEGADLQFIGTLQTNKVKFLVGKVSLIQSVGSVHLGEKRPQSMASARIFCSRSTLAESRPRAALTRTNCWMQSTLCAQNRRFIYAD